MAVIDDKAIAPPRQYLQPWEEAVGNGGLRESPAPPPPSELEMQALWFEGYALTPMTTTEGQTIEILDPGDWNHGAGPDFSQAVIRLEDGTVRQGPVELHLVPTDWEAHGHHEDSAYDGTILHVVWAAGKARHFPATSQYRQVPEVVLGDHLPAPWPKLRPHALAVLNAQERPLAQPGPCANEFASWSRDALLEVIRDAGRLRLQRKAERLAWRAAVTNPKQALWEALAEGLGYAANTRPMRLLAQRLPVAKLQSLPKLRRAAVPFGLSGMLPHGDLGRLPLEAQAWVRPIWDEWWRCRAQFDHAVLRPGHWRLSGVRPWNRPERRLAILPAIGSRIQQLQRAVQEQNPGTFRNILTGIDSQPDTFWHRHASLKGKTFAQPRALLGPERIDDLTLNVFWPLVAREAPEFAAKGWQESEMAPNKHTAIARQRVLAGQHLGKAAREALVQQGLLQIYRDYCCGPPAGCAACTFPAMLRKLRETDTRVLH